MSVVKRRVVIGMFALAMTFGLVGCAADEDSPNTTPPNESTTSEPVGS